jgi:chromosomal replication initiator protein
VDKPVRNSVGGELERSWQRVLERLATRIEGDEMMAVVHQLRVLGATPSELQLEAPNRVTVVCITENYLDPLQECVAAIMGPRQVKLEIATQGQGELFAAGTRRRADRRPRTPHPRLIPRYTFENFIVGASNQFAHAASKAVAGQPGDHYNPLFIYGGVGLGKTHLVNAVGHQVADRDGRAQIAYLSSGAFTADLISGLRRDRMAEFKERFRHVDLLILDDVQLLAGRERTQEEFFHTFNALYDRRRQIILTSDKVPKDIPGLEERLRNRFEWGLIADIQPPDVETRVAIIEKKAEVEGMDLPSDVALFLGSQLSSNVRELEGFLTRLGAYASITRRQITVEFAQEVLQKVLRPAVPSVTFDDIAHAVCTHFSLRPADLRSKRRSRSVALPRQIAMYLCRRHLKASYPHIAELFGRDHSTVIHAHRVTEQRLKDDPALQATLERLERTLRH